LNSGRSKKSGSLDFGGGKANDDDGLDSFLNDAPKKGVPKKKNSDSLDFGDDAAGESFLLGSSKKEKKEPAHK